MLNISNLYAGYTKENPVLKGIDLDINQGDVVGILGRNGSGKSTLAKAICGLVPYVEGKIELEGSPIAGLPAHETAHRGVGFFQQGGRIFPNLTVQENLAFAAAQMDKSRQHERTEELTNWFDLLQKPERRKLKATYLSGGEKHQLALAMVLIQKPRFLILDEPSAGLSPRYQSALYEALERVRSSEQLTMMIIEQNVELAMGFAQKTLRLNIGKIDIN